jgi:hypothetical protein
MGFSGAFITTIRGYLTAGFSGILGKFVLLNSMPAAIMAAF